MQIEIKISDIKSLCHIKLIDDDNAVFEKEVRLDDLIATFRSETTEEHYYPVPKILRQTLLKEKPNIEGLVIGIRNSSLVKGLFFIPARDQIPEFCRRTILTPISFYFDVLSGLRRLPSFIVLLYGKRADIGRINRGDTNLCIPIWKCMPQNRENLLGEQFHDIPLGVS